MATATQHAGYEEVKIRLGAGADTVVLDDRDTLGSCTWLLDTGGGNDQATIKATNGIVSVLTGNGSDTVNIGDTAAGATVSGIKGLVAVGMKWNFAKSGANQDADKLNVNDPGATVDTTNVLTKSTLDGLTFGNPSSGSKHMHMQTITLQGATGGTFRLEYGKNNKATPWLNFNTSAAKIESALQATHFKNASLCGLGSSTG